MNFQSEIKLLSENINKNYLVLVSLIDFIKDSLKIQNSI